MIKRKEIEELDYKIKNVPEIDTYFVMYYYNFFRHRECIKTGQEFNVYSIVLAFYWSDTFENKEVAENFWLGVRLRKNNYLVAFNCKTLFQIKPKLYYYD